MEPFKFVEGDSKSFETTVKEAMTQPMKHYEKELVAVRTNRASTAILDHIKVECYGEMMPLKDVATVAAPDARLITVQPWDKGNILLIEKAILASDIGLTPANDGTTIRLQLPQMSANRRDELIKALGKKTEECRVGIRNVRKEYHNMVREAERKREVSEDFAERLSDLLQKVTDANIKKVDEMHDKKESELKNI